MKKQNKLLAFLLVFALLFSLMGNVAIATAPDEQILQTQEVASPTNLNNLDTDHVYITIQTDDGVAVGRSGEVIVEYPIYANGVDITAYDILFRVHENEYHDVMHIDENSKYVGGKGTHVKQNDSGAFTWIWGKDVTSGAYLMEAGSNDAITTNTNLTPGHSYYINATSKKTSYVTPFRPLIYENTATEFTAKYWDNGEKAFANANVLYGTSLSDLKSAGTANASGVCNVTIPKEGFWYVVFRDTNGQIADAISCVRVTKDPNSITDYDNFTKADGFVKDDLYLIVTEYDGKKYAMRCDGSSTLLGEDITNLIDDNNATVSNDELKWYVRKGDTVETYKTFTTEGVYQGKPYTASGTMSVYAGSQGYGVYMGLARTFRFKDGKILMHEDMYSLKFDGTKFVQINVADIEEAATFELYSIDCPLKFEETQFLPDGTYHDYIQRNAQTNEDGTVTLAFVSDVHHATSYADINLEKWLEAIEGKNENPITYIDAMGFCGDMGSAYSSNATAYWTNVQAILDYMDDNQDMKKDSDGKPTATPTNIGNTIYTFGNHEWYPVAGGQFMKNYGVSEINYINNKPGTNSTIDRFYRVGKAMETDKYEIYCLGAGAIADKMSSGYSDEDIASLKSYLKTAPDDKPIFILVHFPLHFWGDRLAGNASSVVKALNESGKNIYLIWGHNHSDFDENYDCVIRPGSKIVIDNAGNEETINFTYLSAGCISDAEYTDADGGSAWVQGKGVIATINADNTVDFSYYTMDGKEMKENGPYLVTYRDNVSYKIKNTEYVERGKSATVPKHDDLINYNFKGWKVSKDEESVDFNPSNINRHTLVTATYEYDSGLNKNNVYFTVIGADGELIKDENGERMLMYPVKYEEDMTVLDAVIALHDAKYPDFAEDETAADKVTAGSHGELTWVWGYNPNNGILPFGAGSSNGYAAASDEVKPGESYYITLYSSTEGENADYQATSYLAPYNSNIYVGGTLDFIANSWNIVIDGNNVKYPEGGITGDVFIGTSLDEMPAEAAAQCVDGKFSYTFDTPGTYYVVVKNTNENAKIANAYCVVNVTRRNVIINDNPKTEPASGNKDDSTPATDNTPAQTTAPAVTETVKVEAKADASGVAKAAVEAKTVSDAVKSAAESKADSIVIAPEVTGDAKEVKVELPKTAVSEVANGTNAALVVETDKGSLELPNDTLGEITAQAGGASVEIVIAEKSVEDAGVKEAIADKIGDDVATDNAAVAEITVSSGDEKITSFGGKSINASVSVDGKKNFTAGRKYLTLVISSNGKRELLAGKCVADASGKLSVGVKVKHLSTFVVLDKELQSFADADAHWAAEAVDYAVANGLMNGVSDAAFAPNSTLNRAMLVTILYRLAGSPAVAEAAKFADVAAGEWYTEAVAWAAANGIVTGKTETSFAPMENITREQFATMLMRYCKFAGIDTASSANLGSFTDSASISAYAKDALAWANASGIITGRTATTIAPTGSATRGEAATMLMRFMQL